MKIKGYSVTLGLILILISSELCSCTILSGAMFYYLMGSYIAREVFPNVVNSAVKAFVPPASAVSSTSTSTSSSDTDTLASVLQLANAMGLTRQVKELWPELDCALESTLCKKNDTAKNDTETKKKPKPKESVEDDEEAEEEAFSKPDLSASEELSGYKVFDFDDDILAQANEELAEEDPDNFYYALRDQHKLMVKKDRQRKERQARVDLQIHENEQLAKSPPVINQNIITPSFPIPVPRRGVLPIFIRYKVPYPVSHIPQSSNDNYLRNRNGRFEQSPPPYIPIRRNLPPPPQPYYYQFRRPSIFDSLRRFSKNIMPYR